jgi:hypothetical protein
MQGGCNLHEKAVAAKQRDSVRILFAFPGVVTEQSEDYPTVTVCRENDGRRFLLYGLWKTALEQDQAIGAVL